MGREDRGNFDSSLRRRERIRSIRIAQGVVSRNRPDDSSVVSVSAQIIRIAVELISGDQASGDEASSKVYRTQKRGGKGLRDIKATDRNGTVVDIIRVDDDDEVLMMTKGGKIQRVRASEISIVGRNTQGVRIMKTDDGDTIAAVVRRCSH